MFPPLYQNLGGHSFKDDREVGTAATGWLTARHWLVSTENTESDYMV